MTRPSKSAEQMDGQVVLDRLVQERENGQGVVHVDWCRFTVKRAGRPYTPRSANKPASGSIWDEETRARKFEALLRELPDEQYSAHSQALQLAESVVKVLGPSFGVAPEVRKGHDFYRCRWSIERAGVEAGWIGFLASSDSPRQRAQAETLHVNLYGMACTFADDGWRGKLADLIDAAEGVLTRVDLALDFFDGLRGGIERVQADYLAGLCDVAGRHPVCNQLGDWTNEGARGRSFYIGSREAGKQTNAYEKGDQLFGAEHGSAWMRVEVRYGNKLRDLPTAVLRRADEHFAGASDWHASLLAEAGNPAPGEAVRCRGRLPIETVGAEVARIARWFKQTACASAAVLFEHLDADRFVDYLTAVCLPGRLRGFTKSEVEGAFGDVVYA